jgi:uncharacterized membrane protein YcaP (DUF421 family)
MRYSCRHSERALSGLFLASTNLIDNHAAMSRAALHWRFGARLDRQAFQRLQVMDVLITLFGTGRNLDTLQMVSRAVIALFVMLIFIRISGRRSFGQRSPFDAVVAVLLGATLSRIIVGASEVIPTSAACLAIVVLHRTLGWMYVHVPGFERVATGCERQLYADGTFDRAQMSAALVTKNDILESARRQLGTTTLEGVKYAVLERNGEISLIREQRD